MENVQEEKKRSEVPERGEGPAETSPSTRIKERKEDRLKGCGCGKMKPFSSECSHFLTEPRDDVIQWQQGGEEVPRRGRDF